MEELRKIGRQQGFTIVESIIAMFFIAFIVSELAMITMYARRSTNLAQRISRAALLADEAIEKARNTNYDDLDKVIVELQEGAAGVPCAIALNVSTCTSTLDSGRFVRKRIVSPLDPAGAVIALNGAPVSNRAQVEVVVEFSELGGGSRATVTRTIRTATIISRY